MTDSRRLVPGQGHTVCRRTRSRTLFLNPSSFVNSVVLYCLGLAQERHGIAVHAATFESTHYHLGITDTAERSRLADFERDLNVNVARALNEEGSIRRGQFSRLRRWREASEAMADR